MFLTIYFVYVVVGGFIISTKYFINTKRILLFLSAAISIFLLIGTACVLLDQPVWDYLSEILGWPSGICGWILALMSTVGYISFHADKNDITINGHPETRLHKIWTKLDAWLTKVEEDGQKFYQDHPDFRSFYDPFDPFRNSGMF
ncbi:MAG: hypothetical protein WC453_03890 [Patescibacteria group bacterium]